MRYRVGSSDCLNERVVLSLRYRMGSPHFLNERSVKFRVGSSYDLDERRPRVLFLLLFSTSYDVQIVVRGRLFELMARVDIYFSFSVLIIY